MSQIDLVTGAFGYSGTYLRRRLEGSGRTVRTITDHPVPNPGIEVFRYTFDDPDALRTAFRGVDTFYNTYWARYSPTGTTHGQAVANTAALLRAAADAGVRRVVQLSILNPDPGSFYEYYRGKAAVEDLVRGSGLAHAIVRPGVIFGGQDILLNNIAWLIRRFRSFAVPGDGRYRLRPVHVADLAELCCRLGAGAEDVTVDAVGPEWFGFEELVRTIAAVIGVPVLAVHLPPAVVAVLLRGLSLLTRDVVLTRDELDGLMGELVMSDAEASGPTRLTDHLHEHADGFGRRYHSELARRR